MVVCSCVSVQQAPATALSPGNLMFLGCSMLDARCSGANPLGDVHDLLNFRTCLRYATNAVAGDANVQKNPQICTHD